MDTRKIQTVGGGTYTVSLPKDWAESRDIDAGDDVTLHTHIDGVLALQPPECGDAAPERATIRVDRDDPALLERTLRAAYAVGTKELQLEAADGFTDEQRRVVNRVARDLAGVSVADESADRMTVRTLLDTAEISVRQSVRQLKFVTLSTHREAIAAVTGETDPDELAARDGQVDRLYAMIDRSFARGLAQLDEVDALGLTRPELFELWATTRELEHVADRAEGLITVATRIDDTMDESTADEIREMAESAREIVTDGVSVVVDDADVETAREAVTAHEQLREEITSLECRLAESSGSDRLFPVLDRVRRTAEHGGNIAELGLRREIRQDDPGAAGQEA